MYSMQGLFTGRLFDLGHFRLPMFIFSVTLVASTFLIAECTQYWHFVLCQGIALGVGKLIHAHYVALTVKHIVVLWDSVRSHT